MTVIIKSISYQDPLNYFEKFAEQPGAVFLDSARVDENLGRYSYFARDPFLILRSKNKNISLQYFSENKKENIKEITGNPFDVLEKELERFKVDDMFPILLGGVIGYFGYDLCHHLEAIPRAKEDDMQFPDLILGFYDLAVTFDHVEKKAWVASNGFPELDELKRLQRAEERLEYFLKLMDSRLRGNYMPRRHPERGEESPDDQEIPRYTRNDNILHSHPGKRNDVPHSHPGKREALVRDPYIKTVASNFTRKNYLHAVQNVIDYILAGDIFEANISQRFMTTLPENITPFELYKKLRTINAAPFAAYLNFDDVHIASASPERFLRLINNDVETRPIKGTRPRGKTPEEDRAFSEALVNSEKDWAENVMIVDLMRNDLSRVCEPGTVNVTQLCGLESFATVHHLVSAVKGQLKKENNVIDLLRATFPGGSITGAPKIRSMEIISELEPTQRGPYCGSVGFISFDGNMDTSITIRTFAIKDNNVTFQAGGAIVLDSDPAEEYEETLAKARALKRTLREMQ